MELSSYRRWYTDNSTISELFINSEIQRLCFILEPTIRNGKDPRGIVAIPEGKYEITMYDSPKFGIRVPILNEVPGHSYVEIHSGNSEIDTHDCLLPGLTRLTDWVEHSIDAFNLLIPRIENAINTQKVFIEIKNSGGESGS